ncbi:MAG TPA: class I SAM-dependent methyltransferase [Ignavibacteriaceae bacterium]|nr:class I SAM-dependent methyltransferase [Ignavibacteriaceae bacterium]
MNNILKDYIPYTRTNKVQVDYYVKEILKSKKLNQQSLNVLDLGCGKGESLKFFKSLNPNIEWHGIDIDKSPEVFSRTENNERFLTFDGINIPFQNNYFDLIYCKQVLEHVRYPQELLTEVNRVLKPEGYFIGSTSHLEPFHSYSFWNFTPYGFSILIKEVNLKLLELRPTIDSLTLIIRRCLGSSKIFNIFWKIESPLNFLLTLIGKIFRIPSLTINLIKLNFCGQFIFIVQKENLGELTPSKNFIEN